MGILTNAPQGFSEAVSMLNVLPQSLLGEMCQDVMAFLQYKPGFINIDNYEISVSMLPVASGQVIKAEMCINALKYIFRSAALETLSVDALVSELKSSLLFQDSCLVVLKGVWKIEGPNLCSLPKQTLSVGELLSMKWNLGMSMSSNLCRSLNSPHVGLELKVSESRGETKTTNIEMSLPEFQNLATQLKEMSNALETA